MRRKLLIGTGLLLVFIAIAGAALLGPYALRVQHFAANPGAGYHRRFSTCTCAGRESHLRARRNA
jgi:hypothetical protein